MGFETQEQAEQWAENLEFLADQRKEEKLLAGKATTSKETLATIAKSLGAGIVSAKVALDAAYQLGQFDGKLEMALVGQRMVESIK